MLRTMLVAVIGLSTFVAGEARAEFLAPFSGWTSMSPPAIGGSDGLVNFTVYRNNGTTGNWITDLGLPAVFSFGADATSNYVYFYQVVNTDPFPTDLGSGINNLTSFSVTNLAGSGGDSVFSSGGFLFGPGAWVFFDGAPVGPVGNRAIGPEPIPLEPDDVLDGVPDFAGLTPGIIPSPGGGFLPTLAVPENGAGFAEFFFGAGITPGGFSTILFMTSDWVPEYQEARLDDPGASVPSNGDVPVPNPEPASMALMCLGLVGVGGYGWRKRKLAA